MYGKLFASTFTGSMHGSGPDVISVWAYTIANMRKAQVELNPKMLAHTIGMSEERVGVAIEKLCGPDPESRSKAEGGRRLVREGEFAYRVVNAAAYGLVRNEDERRDYNRVKKQESRKRASVKAPVIDSQRMSTVSAHVDVDVDVDVDVEKNPPTPQKKQPRLPVELDTPEMRAAWGRWQQHRIEIRKKLTPTSTASQLSALAKIGPEQAIVRINHTIEMGWQGLRSPEAHKEPTYGGRDLVG